jgi:hypothetical protein
MQHAARRAFMGSVLAGGLAYTAVTPAQAAAWSAREVAARDLRAGDLVVGPGGAVVRVASRNLLASGRYRIRYSDPATGTATAFSGGADENGFAPDEPFVVLLRDTSLASVQLPPLLIPDPDVIDGGRP